MWSEALSYGGLFIAALLAASILPMQSEAVLVTLLLAGKQPLLLLAAASLGNVLGALFNWWLGKKIAACKEKAWFPVSAPQLARAQSWYRRYGRWSLLLSWAPVIGDPLTVAAGVMREPLGSFLLFTASAKVGRYLALIAATLHLSGR